MDPLVINTEENSKEESYSGDWPVALGYTGSVSTNSRAGFICVAVHCSCTLSVFYYKQT
jgi:hypothetical protein